MNTLTSTCLFFFVLCTLASASIDMPKGDMDFLNGLPVKAVEEFINTQLDQKLTKGERETKLRAWAKKQDKKVQKKFDDFMKKLKKDDRDAIVKNTRTIFVEYTKDILAIFFNQKSTHTDVCNEINALADKMTDRMRSMGEKSGPRSHTPCSAVEDKN